MEGKYKIEVTYEDHKLLICNQIAKLKYRMSSFLSDIKKITGELDNYDSEIRNKNIEYIEEKYESNLNDLKSLKKLYKKKDNLVKIHESQD